MVEFALGRGGERRLTEPKIELRAAGAPCPQRAVAECLAADSLMHSTGSGPAAECQCLGGPPRQAFRVLT